MARGRTIGAVVIGGVMLLVGGLYLARTFTPSASVQQAADSGNGTLVIPTVGEMCKSRGAIDGDALKQCEEAENAAGEFVIAWMGYNNFIVDGSINLDQIQAMASLDTPSPLSGLDGDQSFDLDTGGDPSASGDFASDITSGLDPIGGDSSALPQTPAQLALYCLQMANDWVTMHDCISTNDPSSTLGGP